MAGPWNRGASSGRAKLKAGEVNQIRFALVDGLSVNLLAGLFDVSRKTIQNIKHGRSYRWVPTGLEIRK